MVVGVSARVWLDPNWTMIGLAMSRSIGTVSTTTIIAFTPRLHFYGTHFFSLTQFSFTALLTGDYAVKAVGVIPEPEVNKFEVRPSDKLMILGSDGVWEFIESQEAVHIVQKELQKGVNCETACQVLFSSLI